MERSMDRHVVAAARAPREVTPRRRTHEEAFGREAESAQQMEPRTFGTRVVDFLCWMSLGLMAIFPRLVWGSDRPGLTAITAVRTEGRGNKRRAVATELPRVMPGAFPSRPQNPDPAQAQQVAPARSLDDPNRGPLARQLAAPTEKAQGPGGDDEGARVFLHAVFDDDKVLAGQPPAEGEEEEEEKEKEKGVVLGPVTYKQAWTEAVQNTREHGLDLLSRQSSIAGRWPLHQRQMVWNGRIVSESEYCRSRSEENSFFLGALQGLQTKPKAALSKFEASLPNDQRARFNAFQYTLAILSRKAQSRPKERHPRRQLEQVQKKGDVRPATLFSKSPEAHIGDTKVLSKFKARHKLQRQQRKAAYDRVWQQKQAEEEARAEAHRAREAQEDLEWERQCALEAEEERRRDEEAKCRVAQAEAGRKAQEEAALRERRRAEEQARREDDRRAQQAAEQARQEARRAEHEARVVQRLEQELRETRRAERAAREAEQEQILRQLGRQAEEQESQVEQRTREEVILADNEQPEINDTAEPQIGHETTFASLKPLAPALTQAQHDKLRAAVDKSRADNAEVCTSGDNSSITRADFLRIIPGHDGSGDWLNDIAINGFLEYIAAARNGNWKKSSGTAPPVSTYNSMWIQSVNTPRGVEAIKGWSRRKGLQGKVLDAETILFPVNSQNHWTMLAIHPKKRSIEFLDSMHGPTARWFGFARAWLQMELGDKYHEDEWTTTSGRSMSQLNGDDCGVFTCFNGLAVTLGRNPKDVTADGNMTAARFHLASVLLNRGFQDEFAL